MTDTVVNVSSVAAVVQVSAQPATVQIAGNIGPKGLDGTAEKIYLIAAENLGGHRAILASGYYVDITNNAHINRVAGITTASALLDATVNIQAFGELNGFNGLTVNNPVYIGANAVLTQTPPVNGFIQQVGVAVSSTKILINIQPAIQQV